MSKLLSETGFISRKWSGILLATIIGGVSFYYIHKHLRRKSAIKKIKEELEFDFNNSSEFLQGGANELDQDGEAIVKEQLSRNIAFLGEEGVDKLRNSFVVVVGLGGVGSHAAHMLLRAGVQKLRLIDFDQVTLSSLNRHAVATRADVGIPKVIAMKNHLLEVLPHAQIEPIVDMFQLSEAPLLLSGNPDYVLDCIDHLATKSELIAYCKQNNIKVISSMGAGAKSDASKIQIADISETFEDPLARSTRKSLRLKGIHTGVPVVYSIEKPGKVNLLPLDEAKVEEADQYAALPTFRARILPVLGTLPALFGNAMATYVLTDLAGFPTEPLAIKGRLKVYQRLQTDLITAERARNNNKTAELLLRVDDIAFIFEEVWRGRSGISKNLTDKCILVRWDPQGKLDIGNTISMTKAEATKHSNFETLEQVEAYYEKDVLEYIKSRFEKEALWQKSRE